MWCQLLVQTILDIANFFKTFLNFFVHILLQYLEHFAILYAIFVFPELRLHFPPLHLLVSIRIHLTYGH